MREFWALIRNSLLFPFTAVLYGMLPKLVPMPLPGLVDRNRAVKSMKPTGVIEAEPTWSCKGASCASDSCAPPATRAGSGSAGGAVTAGVIGITGVVLATCPSCETPGTACWTPAGVVVSFEPPGRLL